MNNLNWEMDSYLFPFNIIDKQKTNIEILQKVRAEQKSVYALEHMLGYHIKELEELRPHKRNIKFIKDNKAGTKDNCWKDKTNK